MSDADIIEHLQNTNRRLNRRNQKLEFKLCRMMRAFKEILVCNAKMKISAQSAFGKTKDMFKKLDEETKESVRVKKIVLDLSGNSK